MKIIQNDIFGMPCDIKGSQKHVKAIVIEKQYRDVNISDGSNEISAANDAMLIHRILQKKSLKNMNQQVFLRILENEMRIKSGDIDSVTAVRDSLLNFFCHETY